MPTSVSLAAFSFTASAVAFTSVGAVTSNSSRSLIAMVKVESAIEPSALVARMVMSCDAAASRSSSEPSATDTTPVEPSILKRPPASSNSEYVTPFVVASASLDEAVMPTSVSLAAFSFTASAAALTSVGAVTSNSSTSATVTAMACVSVSVPSLTCTVTS